MFCHELSGEGEGANNDRTVVWFWQQLGVATMSVAVQRSGGSVLHPMDAMDEELEQRAAYIEGGAGMEASTMGMAHLPLCHSPSREGNLMM